MTQKEMTQDFAFQEFDACLAKYAKKVKNVLYTIVGHAYNEGYKEGLKQVKSTEVEADKNEIKIGDEVCIYKDDGTEEACSKFFVTSIEPGDYIQGIDSDGDTSFHDGNEDSFNRWKPTGKHVDFFEEMLKKLEQARG